MNIDNNVIIYIGGELPDKDASSIRILSNAKALRKYGYCIKIISMNRELKKNDLKIDCVQGFEVYYIPYPNSTIDWLKDLTSITIYSKIINKISSVVGIICYNHRSISLLRLRAYYKKKKIAVFSDCTEWHTTNHLSIPKRIIKTFDINFRMYYVNRKMNGIIAISSFFLKFYENNKNIILVPPLVDLKEKKIIDDPEKIVFNEILHFLYAGKMGIDKDLINHCINACYAIRNESFIFDIFGCTESDYLKFFPNDKYILQCLKDKISFHGFVSHNVVIEQTKKSDFTLLIRNHNRKNDSGFPTKFGESISCGVPVISTDFSDIKNIIEIYKVGLVLENLNDLSELMKKVIYMPKPDLIKMKKQCLRCDFFDYKSYVNLLGSFVKKGLIK